MSVWALDLLALTGRRRNEILTMTWSMIDWQHSVLNLPDTKGGQLKVPVSARVLGLLKHIHDQTGNPSSGYVLRTAKGTRLRGVNRTWENIRKAAGIPDVRLHDLRHSFASDAIMSGISLAAVGTLLGHKQERTTKRYTHLADDYLRRALEIATDRIVEAATPIAALPPAPFKPMRDAQWKAIAPMVESAARRTVRVYPRPPNRSSRRPSPNQIPSQTRANASTDGPARPTTRRRSPRAQRGRLNSRGAPPNAPS